MKIELKHLAPYLPYGLKIYISGENAVFEIVGLNTNFIEYHEIGRTITEQEEYKYCKPILRNLSDLTKEIEVNGERFIPIIKISKIIADIHNDDRDSEWSIKDDGRLIIKTPWDLRIEMFYKTESICWSVYDSWNRKELRTKNQYLAMQKLFEWNFDVFRLIDAGLSIDINTL